MLIQASSSSSSDELPPRVILRRVRRRWLVDVAALLAGLVLVLVVGVLLGGPDETCDGPGACRPTHPFAAALADAAVQTAGITLFCLAVGLFLLRESVLRRHAQLAEDEERRCNDVLNGGGGRGRRVLEWDCAGEDPASWAAFAERFAGKDTRALLGVLAAVVCVMALASIVSLAVSEYASSLTAASVTVFFVVFFRVPLKALVANAWRFVPSQSPIAPSFTRTRMLGSPALFRVHVSDSGDIVFRGVLVPCPPADQAPSQPTLLLEQYLDGDGFARWALKHTREFPPAGRRLEPEFQINGIVPVPAGRVDELRGFFAAAFGGTEAEAEPAGVSDLVRYSYRLS